MDRTRPKSTESWQARAARYNRLVFALVLPPLVAMLAFAVIQAPLRGDLTRVGGFTENMYGWNHAQERFDPPLVSVEYDRPYDIVVLGDSFSSNPGDGQTDPGAFWTNYLAQRTGLSVVVLTVPETNVRDLLHNRFFIDAPPRLMILQQVERYVIRNNVNEAERWLGPGFGNCASSRPGPMRRIDAGPSLAVGTVPWVRDTSTEFNFDQAVNVLWKSAWRELFGINLTRAERLPLVTDKLFSSGAGDRLLVYDDEFLLANWPRDQMARALCTLLGVQQAIEANGRTRFAFMIAPNKLSAYDAFVADPRFRGLSRLSEFYADRRLNQVALLDPLRAAIGCGLVDVYMPNDTHWGTPAHRIVANEVVRRLVAAAPTESAVPQC